MVGVYNYQCNVYKIDERLRSYNRRTGDVADRGEDSESVANEALVIPHSWIVVLAVVTLVCSAFDAASSIQITESITQKACL